MRTLDLINPNIYFDEIRQYKHVILFGCGGKGRAAVPILKKHGIEITAACDNDQSLRGKLFLGKYIIQGVESATAALKDYCVIITCSITYATEIYNELTSKYPSIPVYHLCSPFKVESGLLADDELWKRQTELLNCYNLLEDNESRNIFCDTLNWKLTGNMNFLSKHSASGSKYSFFDKELIHPDMQSVYVDVGAYTGDTIASFLMFSGGKYKKILGVEADGGNYEALNQFVKFSRVEHIETYNLALWDREEEKIFYTNSINGAVHFDSANLFQPVNIIADNQSLKQINGKLAEDIIYVKTLDSLLTSEEPSIIKINALAADRKIILGGRQILKNCKPALILEFGVTKRDVFEIVPLIKQLNSGYRFFIRRKKVFGDIKTVLYCI